MIAIYTQDRQSIVYVDEVSVDAGPPAVAVYGRRLHQPEKILLAFYEVHGDAVRQVEAIAKAIESGNHLYKMP